MPIALTCDCGARFEVDDFLTGQQVCCPECQHPLRAAATGTGPPRTSWLALLSLVLALAGALTVLGTLAAVVVGLLALLRIHQQRDRLAGTGFALAGIVLGLLFTGITLTLLLAGTPFALGGWLRQTMLTGQVDLATPSRVSSRDGICTLTRPGADWVRVKAPTSGDPAVDDLQPRRDVILTRLRDRAFLDVARDNPVNVLFLEAHGNNLRAELEPPRPPLLGDDERPNPARPEVRSSLLADKPTPPVDGHEGHEWLFDVYRGGQTWRFLIRAYRKKGKPGEPAGIYVIRGYAPLARYRVLEGELRQGLDSVRFLAE